MALDTILMSSPPILDGLIMIILVFWLPSVSVCCLSFPLSMWAYLFLFRCGIMFVGAISLKVTLCTCLSFVRSIHFSRVMLLLISSTLRVLLSGASLILFHCYLWLLSRLFVRTWDFHRVYEFLPSKTCASTPTPSAISLTEQDIFCLKCLLAAMGSSSVGSVGSATDFLGIERPPPT